MSSRVCSHCGGTDIDIDSTRGDAVCTGCGSVLEDQIIVSEVQFQENSGGGSSLIGQFVSSEGPKSLSIGGTFPHGMQKESRTITLQNGKKRIQQLAAQMKLNQHCVDTAFNFFKMAVQKRMTRGRKSAHVVAACLYLVCRTERTPHMLLDFSDMLQVNVYTLGKTYLSLSKELCINLPDIDPCLYIQRFAHALEFGDKTHEVSMTAMRLVQRMKRDWMSTGRRPSGLCGAALLVASRIHDFSRSTKNIIKVVKVCHATLRKRLMEFEDTPSSQLTIEEFQNIDLEEEQDPPCFTEAKRRVKKLAEQSKLPGEYEDEVCRLQDEIEDTIKNQKPRGMWASSATDTNSEDADSSRLSDIQENDITTESPDQNTELPAPTEVQVEIIVRAETNDSDKRQKPFIDLSSMVYQQEHKPLNDDTRTSESDKLENESDNRTSDNETKSDYQNMTGENESKINEQNRTSVNEIKCEQQNLSSATEIRTSDNSNIINDIGSSAILSGESVTGGTQLTQSSIEKELTLGAELETVIPSETTSNPGLQVPTLGLSVVSDCLKDSGDNSRDGVEGDDGELDLTGIDDRELEMFLLKPEEVAVKTRIWMMENADYLREQKEKEERLAKEREEEAKKPESKRKKKYTRKPKQEASSAQEVIQKIIQEKRISSKINYDVLKDLNIKSSTPKPPSMPVKEEVLVTGPVETKPSISRLRKASTGFELKSEEPSSKRVRLSDSLMPGFMAANASPATVVVESGPVQYAHKDEAFVEEEDAEDYDEMVDDEPHLSAAQMLGHTGAEEDYYEDNY